ncbi:MAG: trypsin-like peptidase domain-containing protein [Ruminococcus sp.]|nr:trypsin-like peptidase domain-containing protein [Ruminococcus sp.]MCM1380441.1 trypsin-like peptidase domain-containing protein [Muribaculaceae bacterium]MCM1478411.1 trypsin-like peptidase domain-containing protein [Muribaculaceae bacterium]
MKRFLRILSLLTAAVMLACQWAAVSVSAASAVEDAEQSVVLVAAGPGWGSGFAVGKVGENPRYIVTNCHVIADENDNVYSDITVYFSAAANKFMTAEVVAADLSKDLCVLELPEPTTERKPITLCKSENVSKGDEVFLLGYPAYSLAGKNYNTFDTKDITSAKGSISQQTRINNSGAIGTNVYMTDAVVDGGNSGGPMINSDGQAIGINTWENVMKDDDGNKRTEGGYAVLVDELIPILNSNNVPYTLSTDAAPAAEGEDGETEQTDAAPASEGGNTMMIVIIAAAAVVVIAVVVVVIIVSKNKKPAAAAYSPSPAPAPVQPMRSGGAVITGMKGIMANRSFNINGSLVLGRNSQKCNVCFPVDSKGISGVHCQIRQGSGGYEIMDLGSSNGTFLGSGQRLTPNVPVYIPDGTYFYLGSAEQLFQIKY